MRLSTIVKQLVGFIVRLALVAAVFVAAVAGGYIAYHQYIAARPASASTTYRFARAERGSLTATVSTTGSLAPTNQAKLSFKTGGKLKEVNVRVGDAVKAGAVLARLDTQDLEYTLAQNLINLENARLRYEQLKAGPTSNDITIAKVNLDKAKLNLERAQSDYDRVAWRNDVGMTPQAAALQSATLDYQTALANYAKATQGSSATDLQIQENAVKSSQLQVDQARSNLQGAVIVAPFDGVIAAVSGNVGEMVGATPLITIIDTASLRLEASIDETDIGRIAVGQAVNITLESVPGLILPGRVTSIAPSANLQSGVVTYVVHITPTQTDARLRAGLTATASIVVDQRRDTLYVPNRAVRNVRGAKVVQVAQPDGQIVEKQVQTGISDDNNTEIIAGLSDGEVVAIVATVSSAPTPAGGMFMQGTRR